MSMLPAFQGQASNQQAQAQMNVASAEAESFDEELVQAAPAEGFDVQVSVIPNQFAVNG